MRLHSPEHFGNGMGCCFPDKRRHVGHRLDEWGGRGRREEGEGRVKEVGIYMYLLQL